MTPTEVSTELEAAWKKVMQLDQQCVALRKRNQQLTQELIDYRQQIRNELTKLKTVVG